MNVREIIRDTLSGMVEIGRSEIENAIMECDISSMIQDSIAEQLPDAIREAVCEEIDEAVSGAIADALS